jgi:hypothetical protein
MTPANSRARHYLTMTDNNTDTETFVEDYGVPASEFVDEDRAVQDEKLAVLGSQAEMVGDRLTLATKRFDSLDELQETVQAARIELEALLDLLDDAN